MITIENDKERLVYERISDDEYMLVKWDKPSKGFFELGKRSLEELHQEIEKQFKLGS